jgi:hypothetical protein
MDFSSFRHGHFLDGGHALQRILVFFKPDKRSGSRR